MAYLAGSLLRALGNRKSLQVLGFADLLVGIRDNRVESRSGDVFPCGFWVRFLRRFQSCLGDISGVTTLIRVSTIAIISLASMIEFLIGHEAL
ncbi:hypothetical protein DBIPINDM_008333 (plasmid) [Mesorhizobium sp. AR02]|uniref:hypothetical protein n=1 Tax=Mesorhizobium sp. AR02 TaxID=2865837 RepID=UPI00215EF168|nr:hypothetical protein [Mesorhizobium sp. AR02]UVK57387.1 hypothetical protein DBIPINDM_008333 [Mesorhizobium sp. AR02]